MLVCVRPPPPSTPTTDGDRSALLLGSVAYSNDARPDCAGAQWTFGATRRGIMTLSDQADACVSFPTTPLDSHDRRGPVCASPGIGSLLKRRPTRLRGRPIDGPYSGCNHVAWLMPDAMARCTPPPAHAACRCIPVPTLAPLAVQTERSVCALFTHVLRCCCCCCEVRLPYF